MYSEFLQEDTPCDSQLLFHASKKYLYVTFLI